MLFVDLRYAHLTTTLRSNQELASVCGTDMFAIQSEIDALKKQLGQLEMEVKQAQYLRGYCHAAAQTEVSGSKGDPKAAASIPLHEEIAPGT